MTLRRSLAIVVFLLVLGAQWGCASAPQRFTKQSANFLAMIDPYEAECVDVDGVGCDCVAYAATLQELQAAIVAYWEINVPAEVAGGAGWDRVTAAAEKAETAAQSCGR